ncbi:MAG TPA: ABC transporter permease [Blastocatellia bacterium]
METLFKDLRYAARVLARNRGFTAVAILALALGIGANTAIFSVVNAVLLRPLSFDDPDRLVRVWPNKYQASVSKTEYLDLESGSQGRFEALAAYSGWGFTITGRGEPLKLSGARCTANLFSLLGVTPALGRVFEPGEDRPGHDRVAVISYGLWQSRFGADPNVQNQTFYLDGESYAVIGVMPPGFDFPSREAQMWVPATIDPSKREDFTGGYLSLVGRLKEGASVEQARAEVLAVAREIRSRIPRAADDYGQGARVVPLKDEMVVEIQPALLVLLGAVTFVLLIACVNVANLVLARAVGRQKEIALRTALGAARGRIIRQLLTESALLSFAGGAAGLLLAAFGVELLASLLPAGTPRITEARIDAVTLGFSLALSLATGLLFGLAPALQTSKPDLQTALKEGGRTSAVSGGGRLRSALVVIEIALVLVLLAGAGLLIKSFWRLRQVDPGFRTDSVISLQIAPPSSKYEEPNRKRAFYGELIERAEALPGVESAGAIHLLPMGGSNWNPGLRVEDHPLAEGAPLPNIDWRIVTPGYFHTMNMRLVEGRFFTHADNEGAPGVAIINETLARRYWPDQPAIGKRISTGFENRAWVTVVGVIGDTKHHGLGSETRLEMYRPYDQAPFTSTMTLMVRASSDPAALADSFRAVVWSLDADAPVAQVQMMGEVVERSLSQPRATMLLVAAFAVIALILGAVGVYGVMAYLVSQRTHEIGIRIALGARAGDVLKLVAGRGLKLALIGIGLGIAGAGALTRMLESLLFQVSATDPATFALVSAFLLAVALAASIVPARRASRVDPCVALRHE